MPQTRIGISGWTYAPWRGVFYPKDVAQKRELEYASRQLNSIEINGSFYSLQTPSNYKMWCAATPNDFVFSVKGGRFITHMKKLKDVEVPLANFFASGLLELKEKLGPILWQFPPGFAFNEDRFKAFFDLLPRDTAAMAKLARKHDQRMKGRASVKCDVNRPLRHSVEIRHESFQTDRFIDLCRTHDIAIVVADTAQRWPMIDEYTSDFMYCRLHGDVELYVSGYTDAALNEWATRVDRWRQGGRDVYVYFDNDVKVRAPFDAMNLAARLAGRAATPAPTDLILAVNEPSRERWPALRRPPARVTIKKSASTSTRRATSSASPASQRPAARVQKRRPARKRRQ
jgi:uncharacterized protein YecE (DUF72 family)